MRKLMTGLFTIMLSFVSLCHAQGNIQSSLNAKQQAIVAISALTAQGDLKPLQAVFNRGLNAGLSINEIKEILIQLYAYAGFPRSLNAINTFQKVVEARQKQGIKDELGLAPKVITVDQNKYELGRRNLALLTGVEPATKPSGYAAFVPTIEVFLKEHLFADIFERGVLDYQTRELVTISALASLANVNEQLRSHIKIGFYNGLTQAQLQKVMVVIEKSIGKKEADNAKQVLDELIAND